MAENLSDAPLFKATTPLSCQSKQTKRASKTRRTQFSVLVFAPLLSVLDRTFHLFGGISMDLNFSCTDHFPLTPPSSNHSPRP